MEFRPEIIHVVADAYSQTFVLAGLLLGIPVVGSFHTDIIDLLRTHHAFFFQEWFVLAKEMTDSFVLDAAATTSLSFQQKLRTHQVHCDHVLITAVDSSVFAPARRDPQVRRELTFGDADDAFLCVYVGRISEEKRIDVLVEALRLLRGDGAKAYLAIVGDGPQAAKYAALHGKESRIYCRPRFLSHDELAGLYASSDVHVTASEFETLGNTVLEANACALPVVTPRTQGFVNTVRHGDNGFLFDPHSAQSAAACLQQLKDDAALRAQMGQRALQSVQSCTFRRVVQDLLAWYQRSLARRRQQPAAVTLLKLLAVLATVLLAVVMHSAYDLINGLWSPAASRGGKKKA
eukprot:gene34676-41990_t